MSDGASWVRNELVEDRRRTVRVPAQIEIRFQESVAAAKVFKAYSLNFSVGGLCLKTRRPYAVGTSLHLFIKIEDEEYRISAVVAWKRGDAIGVRFQNLDDEVQQRFVALVESLRR
jgi:uncharacterized protein (TIGR02266 family)